MRDAFGGIVSIVLIAVFLVIVEGILGFLVSYTKAFRMKNIVISSIEEYEGAGCFSSNSSNSGSGSSCLGRIQSGAKSINYHPVNVRCPNGFTSGGAYFCYREKTSGEGNKLYTIVTQVDINIPIIRQIMSLSIFQVQGDTRYLKN